MNNFKHNYLENYDLEVVVKTKNAPFFIIIPNKLFLYRVFSEWSGTLKKELGQKTIFYPRKCNFSANLKKFTFLLGHPVLILMAKDRDETIVGEMKRDRV
jgi:hypothetical protein